MSVYIITRKPKSLGKSAMDRVQKLIQGVSGSPWTHTQMVIDGTRYEATWPKYKKTENYAVYTSDYVKVHKFKTEWTERQKGAAVAWWEWQIARKTGYGLVKLMVYLALAKTKPLWNKIGWCPMAIDAVWGDFCSAAVDTACRFVGVDLLPNRMEEFTAPGDILESELLEEI